MGIIIPGKTTCQRCREIIGIDDEIVGFPSFIPKGSRLWQYNDAAFHRRCFETMADREALEKAFQLHRDAWTNRPASVKTKEEIEDWHRKCFVKDT